MAPSAPFVDRDAQTLDLDRIVDEAYPLAGLVLLFGMLALVPLGIAFAIGLSSVVGVVLTIVAQFVLAVGTGVVLLYVVARGIQLADVQAPDEQRPHRE